MQILTNYHTHTLLCKHASGTPMDYCREALNKGLKVLGFSDHTPLPDNRWPSVRMNVSELGSYSNMIDEAKKKFPELKVLKGAECEFTEEYGRFYEQELLGKFKFDYLIGSVHWIPFKGEWINVYGGLNASNLHLYADHYVETMKSGLFNFMAHPDVFGNCYLDWDKECEKCTTKILEAAETQKIPLEINGYGFLKPMVETSEGKRKMYPWLKFWEMASKFKIRVIINSDAHRPEDVIAGMKEAEEIAERFSLTVISEMNQ